MSLLRPKHLLGALGAILLGLFDVYVYQPSHQGERIYMCEQRQAVEASSF